MRGLTSPRRLWGLMALACFVSVALALVSQHRFGMEPCPWCVLQRIIFLVIGLLALLGALMSRWRAAQLALGLPALLLSLAGGAAALYQNRVAAKSASCALTLADRIISGLGLDRWQPEVFEVRASCADAAVDLLGLPFEFWSLMLFAVLGACAAWLMTRRPVRRR